MSPRQDIRTGSGDWGGALRVWRHFRGHVAEQRRLLIRAGLAALGAVLMQIIQPWPLKLIFDHILLNRERGPLIDGMLGVLGGNPFMEAASVCAVLILITLLRSQFEYGRELNTARAGQRVVSAIRGRLYDHIQKLSPSFHDHTRSGDLLLRLTGDIVMLRDMLVVSLLMAGSSLLVLAGMLAVMLVKDAFMTIVALLVIPALFAISIQMSARLKRASRRQRRKESRVASLAHETIVGIRDVQAFSRERYESRRFERHNRGSLKAGLQATHLEMRLNRSVQMILAAGTAGVMLIGTRRVLDGAISPGDLLVFISYLRGMYRPVGKLARLTRRISKAAACGERVMEVLDTPPRIHDSPKAFPAPPFAGAVEFRDVSFSFPEKPPVLRKLSFVIRSGETVALAGPSGAGKSTLVNLLLRFYEPDRGEVRIDDRNIQDYTLDSLRGQISVVLQESVLFGMSIRDNIGFGKPRATEEAVMRAARRANAHDFILELPDGYDTVIGERGVTLSGGEKRRIAIARAVLRKSPILILDEPTVGIDSGSERLVLEALTRLTRDRTVLLISHHYSTLLDADRILYMEKGRIVESGTHAGLMALEGRYFKQVLRQAPPHGRRRPAAES